MFNLLIAYHETTWETDQLMSADTSRFLVYSSDELRAKFSLEDLQSLKELEQIPTLLMYEVQNKAPNCEVVRYGMLRNIKLSGSKLTFRFHEQGRFQRDTVMEFSERLDFGRWEENHTHWAVKDGDIPSAMMERLEVRYDLVFSFAGEDRGYVKAVAEVLTDNGVRIFYDEYEQAGLWGKDLAEHFDHIYQNSSQYCVIFISQAYVKKMWTRHERKSALARALAQTKEYILPARFDDTKVPGIPSTIAHINLRTMAPKEFAAVILQKLRRVT